MQDWLARYGINLELIPLPLIIAAAVGLTLLILSARAVAKFLTAGRHTKIVWLIDLVLLPLLVVAVGVTIQGMAGSENTKFVSSVWVVLNIILWILGAWLLNRGLGLFFWNTIFVQLAGAECPKLLRHLAAAGIYLLATYGFFTFVLLQPVTGLFISTGVVAGIAGLSLQNLLGDLFSGLAISMERPYRVGDWIELQDGPLGQVVDIGWQSTQLISYNASLYVVPNHLAANAIIHNYSLPQKHYALWFYVAVDSKVAPQLVRRLMLDAALACNAVLNDPAPVIYVGDATTQPYTYMVFVYFEDYPSHWRGKSELFIGINEALTSAGISSAAVKYELATHEAPPLHVSEPKPIDDIRGVKFFEPLSDEDFDTLAVCSTELVFKPGQTVVEEGDSGESLFVVSSGIVAIEKADESGSPIELARLGAGTCLGEMALLTGEKRSATVRAATDCLLVEVPKAAIAPILERRPELAQTFAQMMAERLANQDERFRVSNEGSRMQMLTDYAQEALNKMGVFFGLKFGKHSDIQDGESI